MDDLIAERRFDEWCKDCKEYDQEKHSSGFMAQDRTIDDCISRQAAIAYSISGKTREIDGEKWIRVSEVRESIKTMPSAQPDRRFDEWCTDCKEYDQEKHCCPRWNRVIRNTLQEAQRTGRWINKKYRWVDSISLWWKESYECSNCGAAGIHYWKFCPNCGARMEVEE